jgi:hypothetical protein
VKRHLAWIVATLVVLSATAAGVAAWRWTSDHAGAGLPQISVYSRGTTIRVGPYLYCNVINLNECIKGGAQEQLSVTDDYPVQLSVPAAIARAPWRLLKVYADDRDATTTSYRPDARLAVTVPTVDPQRGRVLGLVVQLLTLVQDETGELRDLPHAEWSVRLVWE